MIDGYLSHCPRCKGECQACDGEYPYVASHCDNDFVMCRPCKILCCISRCLCAIRHFVKENYHLSWHPDGTCHYGTYDQRFEGSETILPWLPYDISEDRLKLLLVFI